MEVLRTKDTYIMCPYNSAHHIRKYKMDGHLVKCRRNYPNSEMVTCDFNSIHEVPQPELAYHHEHCPDKKFAEIAIYQEWELPTSSKILVQPVNFANFPLEEWDDVIEESYDPESYCVENEILRKVDVQSAAKRRNFRVMERNRFHQLSISKELKKAKEQKTIEITEREKDDSISEMMKKLSIGPMTAVIPKISKENQDLGDVIPEDELKLTIKKNN